MQSEEEADFAFLCVVLKDNLPRNYRETLVLLLFPKVGLAVQEEVLKAETGFKFVELMKEHKIISQGNILPLIQKIQRLPSMAALLDLLWDYQGPRLNAELAQSIPWDQIPGSYRESLKEEVKAVPDRRGPVPVFPLYRSKGAQPEEEPTRYAAWAEKYPAVRRKLITELDIAAERKNWEELAIQLKFNLTSIKTFERKESPAKALLDSWSSDDNATMDNLVKALQRMNQYTVIDILNRKS